jgi:hypothetical protein
MIAGKPTLTDLLDWVEGRLSPERSDQISAYVDTADPATLETIEWIQGFLADARSMPLVQPPVELSDRLRDVFVGLHSPEQGSDWTDASLLYDTRMGLAAAGVRSADDGVHLAFDSDLGRFVLDAVPAGPGEVDVQGLIMLDRVGATGVDLAFLQAGSLRRAARAEKDGRIEVRNVPVDVDEMWLTSGGTRVRARLDLQSP